jgi:hypothetical protein
LNSYWISSPLAPIQDLSKRETRSRRPSKETKVLAASSTQKLCQFVGREIRLLDYIEGVSQPLGYYAGELRRRGWSEAIICPPHDGVATNNITGKRYVDHWREAGFECDTPIKNTGAGAAMMRVEAAKVVSPGGSLVLIARNAA